MIFLKKYFLINKKYKFCKRRQQRKLIKIDEIKFYLDKKTGKKLIIITIIFIKKFKIS